MRLLASALFTLLGVAVLAGCSGLGSTSSSQYAPVGLVPAWMHPAGIARLRLGERFPRGKSKNLIYAVGPSWVTAYSDPNDGNYPPICTVSSNLFEVNGFGVDPKGDTMIPGMVSGSHFSLYVFKPNCGALAWSAGVSSGQPVDAYTNDDSAITGKVLVSEINYSTGAGALVLCSRASGCGMPFSNSAVTGYGAGVAMAKNGDCWLSAATSTTAGFVLAYFKGCSGSGTVATGTSNAGYGGLFIDTKGQLGSIDRTTSTLYVYKGCNPACALVSTSPLQGDAFFGGLDAKGKHLAYGDDGDGVGVYSYSPVSGATYQYKFNEGFGSSIVPAAHFAPRNKKV